MPANTFYINTNDNHRIAIHHWPSGLEKPEGIFHWMHGMAEHGLRYEQFAHAVNQAGWEFYVHDHRGHGQSVDTSAPLGHFADKDGWALALGDVSCVQQWIRQQHIGVPIALGGHSMGSFFALNWAQDYADVLPLAGLLLCASDFRSPRNYAANLLPVRFERRRNGPRKPSALIRRLTFKAWAKQFPQDNSDSAWISSDKKQVQAYDNDALCGFNCTTQLWWDLLTALLRIHRKSQLAKLDKELPIMLLGGKEDPMNDNGKRLEDLQKALVQTGSHNVNLQLYNGIRHEVFHDVRQDDATTDVVNWLNSL